MKTDGQTHAQEGHHVTLKIEIRVMLLSARKTENCQEIIRKERGKRHRTLSSPRPQRALVLPTP